MNQQKFKQNEKMQQIWMFKVNYEKKRNKQSKEIEIQIEKRRNEVEEK